MLSYGVPFGACTRDVWLICLSNVIGALGEGLYFWVFPLYVQSLQADYVQLGLVFSVLYGVSALAPLPGGFLADRFDRKKILLLAWAPWVFSPLIYSFADHWTMLIPGTICWGVSMIGVPAANAIIITCTVDKKRIASVVSFVWACYSFSYIFAPAVGAYLAGFIGMRWVLRVSAVLTAAATGVFFFLHSQHPIRDKAGSDKSVVSSKEESGLWRKLLVWSVFFSVIMFFMTLARTFVPTFLAEESGLNEFLVGLFGSINFAGITFIGIALGRLSDRWKKSRTIGLCLLLFVVSILPLLLIRDPTMLMFLAFFYGGSSVIGPLVSSFTGTIAPEAKRGLWMSIPLTLSLVAAFVAPFVGGFLYTLSPFYVFAVAVVAVPFLVLFAFKRLKE
jgi:MFS family permease